MNKYKAITRQYNYNIVTPEDVVSPVIEEYIYDERIVEAETYMFTENGYAVFFNVDEEEGIREMVLTLTDFYSIETVVEKEDA